MAHVLADVVSSNDQNQRVTAGLKQANNNPANMSAWWVCKEENTLKNKN